MRKVIIAAFLLGGAATPALAQNQGVFSGPRVEALVGYDAVKAGDRDTSDVSIIGKDDTVEGAIYGGRVGYDNDLGPVVLGVDAELTDTTADLGNKASGTNVEFGRDIYVGGRAGVKASPTTLVYGGVGYTNAAVDTSYDTVGGRVVADGNVDGYRLSTGVEQAFGENSFGRLEYRYSNYGNFELGGIDARHDINLDRHQVVASVGFRF